MSLFRPSSPDLPKPDPLSLNSISPLLPPPQITTHSPLEPAQDYSAVQFDALSSSEWPLITIVVVYLHVKVVGCLREDVEVAEAVGHVGRLRDRVFALDPGSVVHTCKRKARSNQLLYG